jgi:hemerythrin-like domain-containing protein
VDAIELLTGQHGQVTELVERFQGSDSDEERLQLATQVIAQLRAHATLEEEIFYPAAREAGDELEDDILEDLEEHHVVEVVLDELEGMDPGDERYAAKFLVASELVDHHVEEEEQELFPRVSRLLSDDRLRELGSAMQERHEQLQADAEDKTKEELYEVAQDLDIPGRSSMSKRQLADAVRRAG